MIRTCYKITISQKKCIACPQCFRNHGPEGEQSNRKPPGSSFVYVEEPRGIQLPAPPDQIRQAAYVNGQSEVEIFRRTQMAV